MTTWQAARAHLESSAKGSVPFDLSQLFTFDVSEWE
jgi:hypothetical protein